MKKYAGRPFALVGVNADFTLEAAKEQVKENGLNWRSFFDPYGEKIAVQYGEPGFPHIMLIDPDGVIQFIYKLNENEALDAKIEEMVAEAESK